MPIATVTKETSEFKLTTLPGAFVIIRRMTYGEKLERQEEMLNMKMSAENSQFEFKMLSKSMAFRDFSNLVIDHNLTDETERKLNFNNSTDVASLDPRVGEEIGSLIDKINTFEDSDATKNS